MGLGPRHCSPCDAVKLPQLPAGRDRRLSDADQEAGQEAEEALLRKALADMPDASQMLDIFDIALLTGMRRGEILGLTVDEIQKAGNVWRIVKVKHKTAQRGHVRRIVLPSQAVDIINRRIAGLGKYQEKLFPISVDRFKGYWRKATKLAGVKDLHFHDTRHESLSRMADAGLTLGELQAQSGHKTAQMLMRYLNAKPKDIAEKLG